MLSDIEQEPREIYTVSQLNAETRYLLEDTFDVIWIVGEISNLARPSSGHFYFSLKDNRAQVRCALFRNSRRKVNFIPEDGQQVLVQAQVSLYEPRGDFQLIVLHMEMAGDGALQIAFEKLKKQLSQEGLFDEVHKKTIPYIPAQVGIITSSTGAALRDILKVLHRRFPPLPIIIYPTLVQGNLAAKNIVEAIKTANRRKECDVLILSRGGGSLEDLWPFNEEIVARAIFASHIPIVAGIGHEVDFTIADFVADERAPTPSAAAEIVAPNKSDLSKEINQYFSHLLKSIKSDIKHGIIELAHLSKRLRHPGQRIREQMQFIDQMEQSLSLALQHVIAYKKAKLEHLNAKFSAFHPKSQIANYQHYLKTLSQRLNLSMSHQLKNWNEKIKNLAFSLDAINPLRTLERGFSIVTKKDGMIVRNAKEVKIKERVLIKLAHGKLDCEVEKIIDS